MYEYIAGHLSTLEPTRAVVDCGGVGYLLEISLNTYQTINASPAQEVKLLVHEVIRDDAHLLYGFADEAERSLFRLLIEVSGVGVQTARVMLSSMTVDELTAAIAAQEIKKIQKIKGIGAKTAQRIALELADKVGAPELRAAAGNAAPSSSQQQEEAAVALTMLGFPKTAVDKVLAAGKWTTDSGQPMTVEEIIKEALKRL
ncbi:MAG: Holliday junction branch migration protein RuvA [Bacteroidales bacterium]|nr:Holliday junction branch migration protein RuvA [Bacteroidales bacterium]